MGSTDVSGLHDDEGRLSVVPLNDFGRNRLRLRARVAMGIPMAVAVLIVLIVSVAGAGAGGIVGGVIGALVIAGIGYLIARPYLADLRFGSVIRYRGEWKETPFNSGQGMSNLRIELPVSDARAGQGESTTTLSAAGDPFVHDALATGAKWRQARKQSGHVDFTPVRHLVVEVQYRA